MVHEVTQLDVILWMVTSILTITVTFTLLVAHYFVKKMRKPPGMLIVWEIASIFLNAITVLG